MEILAPAGNPEALKSAWAAGADAVYLGYSVFSARAGAGNFNEEELKDAIRFAHLHRMRVYVTVNTLVKDAELDEALALMELLKELKADGVLIQDLGLLRRTRMSVPELPLHASTQMAIHHAAGVRWCRRMGMKRVVLARECSLQEIRRCTEEGPEIEVFCHGAQCVAVSGLCLFSSMVGGRSGNRGRCAQPCRMIYEYRGKEGAWLSPRDVCLRDELPALTEAGAVSLKIEGRLKRPEYVEIVTESYRQAMDRAEAGTFMPADDTEREALRQIFNRGGFMKGYAFGSEDADVIWPESVRHQGIELGRVEAAAGGMARVRLNGMLHDGDSIRLIDPDGREEDMIYSGKETDAGEIAVIRLRRGITVHSGDRVLRLTDERQLKAARDKRGKAIPVRMHLWAWPGKQITLTVSDGESTVSLTGEKIEAASTREATQEELKRQLAKTGGSEFEAVEISVDTKGAFVPFSSVNMLRRKALDALAEKRIAAFEAGLSQTVSVSRNRRSVRKGQAAKIPAVAVRTAEQAEESRKRGLTVCWYPEDYRPEAMELLGRQIRSGEWLRLPDVCEENTLERLRDWTADHRETLGGVVLGTVGQLGLDWEVAFGAGPGIPVFNREAVALLAEEGCTFVTASPELTGAELAELTRKKPETPEVSVTVPVYGRTQLMLLHHCPARTAMGLRKGHRDCRMCDTGDKRCLHGQKLRDRKGYAFPLLRMRLEEGCLVRLMNALPTDLMDKDITAVRTVELTEEDGDQTALILKSFQLRQRIPGETTRGHWSRPTE